MNLTSSGLRFITHSMFNMGKAKFGISWGSSTALTVIQPLIVEPTIFIGVARQIPIPTNDELGTNKKDPHKFPVMVKRGVKHDIHTKKFINALMRGCLRYSRMAEAMKEIVRD